jgi:hypothetical protein
MGLKEDLAAMFPKDYWGPFRADFQHDFFEYHMPRTVEYDRLLKEKIQGKTVLEVGGYPGLLTAYWISIGCTVETIESPNWFPDWYKAWAEEKKYPHHVHDIITGAPALEKRFDWITISDVFIHMDGLPVEFIRWAVEHGDKILLAHYPGKNFLNPAKNGTLRNTWDMPTTSMISNLIESFGGEVEEELSTNDRVLLIYSGKK